MQSKTDKRSAGWTTFYQGFKNTNLGTRLSKTVPKNLLQQFLSPVLTVAEAIERGNLLPDGQDHLTIHWLGAELPEMVDGGRWFGVLPQILDREIRISIKFTASKVKPFAGPNPLALSDLPPVEILTDDSSSTPDIVVWSHPENVSRWQAGQQLATIGQTPVIALYWSALDTAMEREWFHHEGFTSREMWRNEYDLENKVDSTATWGRFVDLLVADSSVKAAIPKSELKDLGMIRHHSGLMGMAHPAGQPGLPRKTFKVRSQQTDDQYLYVLDDLFLNLATHQLYRFDDHSRQLHPVAEVDRGLIHPLPRANTDILEAYRWGARIKLSYAFTPPEKTADAELFSAWLAEATDRGVPEATYAYARWIEAGYIGEPNPLAASKLYRRAADAGHVSAQYTFADIAFHDLVDVDLAVQYFQRAAEAGHAMASFNMALLHLESMIDSADPETGIYYLKQAAERNEVNALTYLGQWYLAKGDVTQAMEYWYRAGDRGSLEAAGYVLDQAPRVIPSIPQKERKAFDKRIRQYQRMIRQHQRPAN